MRFLRLRWSGFAEGTIAWLLAGMEDEKFFSAAAATRKFLQILSWRCRPLVLFGRLRRSGQVATSKLFRCVTSPAPLSKAAAKTAPLRMGSAFEAGCLMQLRPDISPE